MKYITEAIRIFFKKDNFIYFFKIQAFLLPLAFVSVVWSLILAFKAESLAESLSTNPIFIFSSVALNLLNAVIYLFVAVASIEAIRRVLENSSFSVYEAFLVAKARVWKFLSMGILKGVVLLAGFLLLIVPGVIFSVWFAFSRMEIVLNNVGAKESLSKSKALVAGRFWSVFGRLFVIGIFVTVFQVVFTTFPYGLGNLISPLFGILFTLPVYLLYRELEAHMA